MLPLSAAAIEGLVDQFLLERQIVQPSCNFLLASK